MIKIKNRTIQERRILRIIIDGFAKSPISALRAIFQNFTYAKYAAFFEIAQALILNFLQSRQIATFYECVIIESNAEIGGKNNFHPAIAKIADGKGPDLLLQPA